MHDKDYTERLKEDLAIRRLIDRRLANASVIGVEMERGINYVTSGPTAKPGIVIGKGGANVERLRKEIGRVTTRKVKLEIKEIRRRSRCRPRRREHRPAARRRIAYKKALKQAIERTMKAGAKGVNIPCPVASVAPIRVAASRIAKAIPLGTLRADISYGQVGAPRPTAVSA